jgi:hypothetical protein
LHSQKKNGNDGIPLIADELEQDEDEVTLQDELKDQPRQKLDHHQHSRATSQSEKPGYPLTTYLH